MKARHFLSFLRRSLRRSFLSDALLMSPDLASRFFLRRSRRSSSLGATTVGQYTRAQAPTVRASVPVDSWGASFWTEVLFVRVFLSLQSLGVRSTASLLLLLPLFLLCCARRVSQGTPTTHQHRDGANLATFQCCHVLGPFPWHSVVLHCAHTSLYLALLNGFQSLLLHCLDALGLLDDLDAFLCASR